MSATQRDYYDILGVSKNASKDEIKKAFRKMAKQYHPDVNQAPEAEAKFKELGEAFGVLSDEQKRQIYDTYGHEGLKGGGHDPGNWDFVQGFPDLNDLFSTFFGGEFGHPRGGKRNPYQGENLRFDLILKFDDAAFGVKKEIEIHRLGRCGGCNGAGSADGSGPSMCQTCGGGGQVRQTTQTILGHFTQVAVCPNCHGMGKMITNPCGQCNGEGREEQHKKLTVTVPPGVDNGTQLRVAGEGHSGPLGGPPGDLFIVMNIEEHATFKRDGYNVVSLHAVSYATMALGGDVTVPVLRGEHTLKIPAGTQNGHVFTIREKGIPVLNQSNRRGDHFVQVHIEIPKKLDSKQKELLKQLKALEDGDAATATKGHSSYPGNRSTAADSHDSSVIDKFKSMLSGAGALG